MTGTMQDVPCIQIICLHMFDAQARKLNKNIMIGSNIGHNMALLFTSLLIEILCVVSWTKYGYLLDL